MTTPTCTHGYPTPAACIDCMADGPVMPPSRPELVTVEATFTARYDGHCSGCNLPVGIGQVVHLLSDGRYVHQGCE